MIGTKDPMQLNVNAQQPLFPLPSLASMPMMQGYPSPTYENPQPSYYRPTTTTMRPTTYSSYYTTTTTPPSTTAYPSKKPLMPLMPLMPLNLIPISSFRPDMESLVFNEEDFRNAAEEDLSGVSYD